MENTIKKDVPQRIIGAIADALDVSFQTAKRWFENDDIRLTTEKAKQVFEKEGFNWAELEKG